MKRIIFLSLIFATIFIVSCKKTDKTSEKKTAEATPKREIVRVLPLNYQKIARTVDYSVSLMAFDEIHMAPAAPGRIDAIYVEVGNRVAAGDKLVQMDRTQLHQAEVQLKTLETDYRRLDTLLKAGSIAQQQYDQIKAQYEITRANVEFLRDNILLKAPFSGIISGKYYEAGEMYSGAPIPTIGKAAIVSLVKIDRLKAIVPVSEKLFPLIKIGMEVQMTCDIYPGRTFIGRIFRIHPTIDQGSRSFNVEVSVDNREGLLRPGMFSRVTMQFDQVEALLVPAIAVLKMQGSIDRYLFIAENGVARRIPVKVGSRYDDNVEVISDQLKQGDRVIIGGQARLNDGMQIDIASDQQ